MKKPESLKNKEKGELEKKRRQNLKIEGKEGTLGKELNWSR